MIEYPVGTYFRPSGEDVVLQVCRDFNGCMGCYYDDNGTACNLYYIDKSAPTHCIEDTRSDDRRVIYREVGQTEVVKLSREKEVHLWDLVAPEIKITPPVQGFERLEGRIEELEKKVDKLLASKPLWSIVEETKED